MYETLHIWWTKPKTENRTQGQKSEMGYNESCAVISILVFVFFQLTIMEIASPALAVW